MQIIRDLWKATSKVEISLVIPVVLFFTTILALAAYLPSFRGILEILLLFVFFMACLVGASIGMLFTVELIERIVKNYKNIRKERRENESKGVQATNDPS